MRTATKPVHLFTLFGQMQCQTYSGQWRHPFRNVSGDADLQCPLRRKPELASGTNQQLFLMVIAPFGLNNHAFRTGIGSHSEAALLQLIQTGSLPASDIGIWIDMISLTGTDIIVNRCPHKLLLQRRQ